MREATLTILHAHVTELFVHVVLGQVKRVPNDRKPRWPWGKGEGAGSMPPCPLEGRDDDRSKDDAEERRVESGHRKLDVPASVRGSLYMLVS